MKTITAEQIKRLGACKDAAPIMFELGMPSVNAHEIATVLHPSVNVEDRLWLLEKMWRASGKSTSGFIVATVDAVSAAIERAASLKLKDFKDAGLLMVIVGRCKAGLASTAYEDNWTSADQTRDMLNKLYDAAPSDVMLWGNDYYIDRVQRWLVLAGFAILNAWEFRGAHYSCTSYLLDALSYVSDAHIGMYFATGDERAPTTIKYEQHMSRALVLATALMKGE